MPTSSPPSSGSRSLERKLQRLAPTGGKPRAFLLLVEGPRAGKLHLLGDTEMVIGRSDNADIVLQDPAVSGEHARITLRPDGFYLTDLGSRNGVMLNGVLISERKLRKRDQIQIGQSILVFLEEAPHEATLTVALHQDAPSTEPRPAHVAFETAHPGLPEPQEPNPFEQLVRRVVTAWHFVKRNAIALAVLPALGLAGGYYSTRVIPAPEFAQATVKLVHYKQPNPVERATNMRGEAMFFEDPGRNFANPVLVRETLEGMGIEPADRVVGSTTGGLSIEAGKSGQYKAKFEQPSKPPPEFSTLGFLERYLDSYLTYEVKEAIKVWQSEADFLKGELAKVETELHQVEEELLKYRSKHLDALPEQAGAAMNNKQMFSQSKAELELEIERLTVQLANVNARIQQNDSVVTKRVQDLKPLQSQIDTKRRALSALRAKGYKSDHPEVKQLTEEIAALEREVDAKMNSRVTNIELQTDAQRQDLEQQKQQYEGDLRVAESALARVNKQLAGAAGTVAAVPVVETTIQRLSRRQGSLQALRGQLFDQHRKTLVQIDLEKANVRARYEIVAPPKLHRGQTPIFLGKRLGLGLGVGLVLALLVAGVFEVIRLLKRHPDLLRA